MKTQNKLFRTWETQPLNGYSHLHIQVIDKIDQYCNKEVIFEVSFQRNTGEQRYYAMQYNARTGKFTQLEYMCKLAKKFDKKYFFGVQPIEYIEFLISQGFRQCEYYDTGFEAIEDVKKMNFYKLYSNNSLWCVKLVKKPADILNEYSPSEGETIRIELSEKNDIEKSKKTFDISTLKKETIEEY